MRILHEPLHGILLDYRCSEIQDGNDRFHLRFREERTAHSCLYSPTGSAERGEIDVLTANITNSECQHLDGLHDEDVQRLFRSLLTSGKVIKIVTDSVFISERAQELRWTYGIKLRGADAHHLATAIEAGCEEFITFDGDFLDKQELIAPLIRVIEGHRSNYLPSPDQPRPVVAIESVDSDAPDSLLFDMYEEGGEEGEE